MENFDIDTAVEFAAAEEQVSTMIDWAAAEDELEQRVNFSGGDPTNYC